MSLLEKRLQLLLDADRYQKVSQEAERSGRSVAAVIREAIDLRFPAVGVDVRMAAATELLALDPGPGIGEGPEELKAIYETTDGFEIARADLQLRGPGEFIGARQSASFTGTGILTPAENSEISTTTSVRTSSSADSLSGLKWNRLSALGPTSSPKAR